MRKHIFIFTALFLALATTPMATFAQVGASCATGDSTNEENYCGADEYCEFPLHVVRGTCQPCPDDFPHRDPGWHRLTNLQTSCYRICGKNENGTPDKEVENGYYLDPKHEESGYHGGYRLWRSETEVECIPNCDHNGSQCNFKCNDGFVAVRTGDSRPYDGTTEFEYKCVEKLIACNPEFDTMPEHATAGVKDATAATYECLPTACEEGYYLADEKGGKPADDAPKFQDKVIGHHCAPKTRPCTAHIIPPKETNTLIETCSNGGKVQALTGDETTDDGSKWDVTKCVCKRALNSVDGCSGIQEECKFTNETTMGQCATKEASCFDGCCRPDTNPATKCQPAPVGYYAAGEAMLCTACPAGQTTNPNPNQSGGTTTPTDPSNPDGAEHTPGADELCGTDFISTQFCDVGGCFTLKGKTNFIPGALFK